MRNTEGSEIIVLSGTDVYIGHDDVISAEEGRLWIRVSGSYQYNGRTWTFGSFTQVTDGFPRD